MSFDFIILKPEEDLDKITDICEVESVGELGSSLDVYSYLAEYFPGCHKGLWLGEKGQALEIANYQDNSQSLHLSLVFGPNWDESMSDEFIATLKVLCAPKNWAAFSIQDNERIA